MRPCCVFWSHQCQVLAKGREAGAADALWPLCGGWALECGTVWGLVQGHTSPRGPTEASSDKLHLGCRAQERGPMGGTPGRAGSCGHTPTPQLSRGLNTLGS